MEPNYPAIGHQVSMPAPQSSDSRYFTELAHRAMSLQISAPTPQLSNYYFFAEAAQRAGYLRPESGWIRHDNLQYYHRDCHSQPHHLSMYEVMKREIEKERIRESIIMSETARRHVPEAEVKRQLMMERDLVSQRAGNEFSLSSLRTILSESLMRLPSSLSRVEERIFLVEIISRLVEERERLNRMHESVRSDPLPFQRGIADLQISKSMPVGRDNQDTEKGRIVLLAKPDENASGSKRKAVTHHGMDASGFLKKKAKVEWSCAVCRYSAFTEKELNEHLRGRKHKREEAKMRKPRRGSKNFRIGFFEKKSSNCEFATESLKSSKTVKACSKKEELTYVQKYLNSHSLKKNKREVAQNMQKRQEPMKRRCRAHKSRKHGSRLPQYVRNDTDAKRWFEQ